MLPSQPERRTPCALFPCSQMKPLIAEKLKAYKNRAERDSSLGPQISLAILETAQG